MADKLNIAALKEALDWATPGPWRAGRSEFYLGIDGPLTTRVYTDVPVEEFDVSGDNCRRNAALIAMAPAMAEALVKAWPAVQAAWDHLEANPVDEGSYQMTARDKLEAALADFLECVEGGE